MQPNVFYGWKIWTAGWPFQYLDPSSTQPWCCNWCSMWSGIVMLENARSSLKETTFWMGAYVVLELGYTFQHWWCLSRCVSCPCHTHSCNPYHQRCRLLNWALITTWVVLVLFSPDDMASQFSKNNFKFWFVWPQNSFSTLPQSILNEPWPRENACASGSCLDMASFLTYRVLASNGEWHGGLCSRQCFLEVFLSHVVISITVAFLYVMQCRLRARRSRASSMVFRPWPLTHRDCSRFSESLDDIMHCRWW